MPQVGENLTTGVVLEWCKAEGEAVSRGDVIATVESEKAAFEVVAEEDGVLLRQDVAAGEEARVLEPIAWIGAPGEQPDQAGSAPVPPPERETAAGPAADTRPSPSAPGSTAAEEPAPAAGPHPSPSPGSMPAPPPRESPTEPAAATRAPSAPAAARRPSPSAPSPAAEAAPGPLAARPSQSAESVPGPASRPVTSPARRPRTGTAAGAQAPASPSARRLARQLLVDLSSVRGTGPGGRVVRRDVLTAALNESGGPAAPAAIPAVVEQGDRPAPHSRLRRAVAERMSASARHVPHFHLFADVDVTEAQALRRELGGDPAVSLTDLLVAAAARALRRHERLNAHVGDSGLVLKAGCHVGLAVAVEEGVLVPALADADRKSLAELAEARAALVESARRGLVPPDPAPTFTVTNLGGYGITRFLPLINPPGVRHPRRRPQRGAGRGPARGRGRARGDHPGPGLRPPGRGRSLRRRLPGGRPPGPGAAPGPARGRRSRRPVSPAAPPAPRSSPWARPWWSSCRSRRGRACAAP